MRYTGERLLTEEFLTVKLIELQKKTTTTVERQQVRKPYKSLNTKKKMGEISAF